MAVINLSSIESKLYSPEEKNKLDEFVHKTHLPGVFYLKRKHFEDNRGFYAELARIPELEMHTKTKFQVKQTNLSNSKTNVIRGFHAEDWNKLIHIVTGTCLCVLADTRPESETFGDTAAFLIGGDHQKSLDGSIYIPKGVANSFLAIEGPVNYVYAVDALYQDRDPNYDVAISLWDQDLAVEWPIAKDEMIFSDRDRDCISLREKFPEKF